ncbi:Sulfite reductase [ferredoxin] [Methyloligella halotolerans]|uniref:Sulfite reductase [ferredoxin] n=1 Tax=Methyloligella halotolerans TaxID=1177755 RepID=A0A1E2S1D8_9HYPH|nr:precorrin-3B synthase [Methyloligella halotolerans]ODA68264.1 Sulfite reductase [ferredoxin] [Methyloligella halotolerans]
MSAAPARIDPREEARAKPEPRGWCPGALRPMESGDGLIVRLRPRCGAFTLAALRVIAGLARRFGNGQIDLTRRANLQLRGLREEDLPALWEALAAADLLDDSAEAESVRNVMVGALGGVDPSEILDPRPIARALEARLIGDPQLWQLPGKFGFSVDGGGAFSIAHERADIRLCAIVQDGSPLIAIGLDRRDGVDWAGVTAPEEAADMAAETARLYLEMLGGAQGRLRERPAADYSRLRDALARRLPALQNAPDIVAPSRALGCLSDGGDAFAFAMAAPFGRIEAEALQRFTDAAEKLAVPEIRLSPWRTLYIPLPDPAAADALAGIAAETGCILDANDPLLAIDACTGAPGCRQGYIDTRQIARDLAPHLQRLGIGSCHVSGCAKGCARSAPAELVVVGTDDGCGLNRYATADAPPRAVVPRSGLSRLPQLLETL